MSKIEKKSLTKSKSDMIIENNKDCDKDGNELTIIEKIFMICYYINSLFVNNRMMIIMDICIII